MLGNGGISKIIYRARNPEHFLRHCSRGNELSSPESGISLQDIDPGEMYCRSSVAPDMYLPLISSRCVILDNHR